MADFAAVLIFSMSCFRNICFLKLFTNSERLVSLEVLET